MRELLLLNFVYPSTATEVDKAQLYNSIEDVSVRFTLSSLIFGFCVILGFYITIIALGWWVERSGMVGNLKIFKIVTFGIGNAEKINGVSFFIITTAIYLAIIGVVSGILPQLVAAIMEWILRIIRVTDLFKL